MYSYSSLLSGHSFFTALRAAVKNAAISNSGRLLLLREVSEKREKLVGEEKEKERKKEEYFF
jgi:hypothetical protein